MSNSGSVPLHVGYIVDGNRRWAKLRGIAKLQGHKTGFDVLKDIAKDTINMGTRYVSAYVFSNENWQRSKSEVAYLMRLVVHIAEHDIDDLIKENIKLIHVGSRDRLSPRVLKAIDSAVSKSAHCTKGVLALCINYGGQQEIVDAAKKLLAAHADPKTLTSAAFADALYAPELPNMDVLVRTSGEQRLSGFMLWRAAYAELIFIKKFWPDMTSGDVTDIFREYANRQRRFGQ